MVHNRLANFAFVADSDESRSESGRGLAHQMEPLARQAAAKIESTIRGQPLVSLTVGIVIGVIAGCLIKRR